MIKRDNKQISKHFNMKLLIETFPHVIINTFLFTSLLMRKKALTLRVLYSIGTEFLISLWEHTSNIDIHWTRPFALW